MDNFKNVLRVASYQGPIVEKEPETNLAKTFEVLKEAHNLKIDILCMPESYVHGYLDSEAEARKYSVNLQSDTFKEWCHRFKAFSPTMILGLNELENDKIYNTAVVIENGECIGKYRKAYTYPPYDYYSLGNEFPIFEKKGVKYSIIICLDSAFREPALISALKGARVLFCPMFNRVNKDVAIINYLNRKSHFISRAFDNHCWVVSSDITWGEESDMEVGQGFSTVVDSEGQVVAQAQPFTEMMLSYDIPIAKLEQVKKWRLLGNPDLFSQVEEQYAIAIQNIEEKAT
ncbi:MAG: hypothetical protein CMF48_00815 [Legionellales bacterium]|nr:hypothetical protein [Legionellales bacterium]|tara:strand:- start:200 stop:1063 length:864 start_codon:yes stop_codon:yes gene_type:complete